MYDAPLDPLSLLGWSLAGLALLLAVVRAVRVEYRGAGPTTGPRVADRVLGGGLALVVTALFAVLVTIAWIGLG